MYLNLPLPISPAGDSLHNETDYINLKLEPEQRARERPSNGRRLDHRPPKRKASALENDTSSRIAKPDYRTTPWMDMVDWNYSESGTEMLDAEIDEFMRYVTPTADEHHVRILVIDFIRRSVVGQWPEAKVYAFGSQETQTYLPDGDIDLVVHHPGISVENREAIVAFLRELSLLLQKSNVSRRINVIGRARVPIIKFVTIHGHYSVDISVNQIGGVRAIHIVNRYLGLMPAVRPLVMIIKAFLLQRGLNEPYNGGFGSYTVICMVISFLQMHPKVRRRDVDPIRNLGVMLLDFLELYGRLFNYWEVGICLRNGGSYFSKQRRGWAEQSRMQLAVEDPGDPTNDIARSSAAGKVRDALAAAFETLKTGVSLRSQSLEARKFGRHVDLGGDRSSDLVSLLGSVVGLSQKMLNFRAEVRQLHDEGTLQRILEVPFQAPPVPVQVFSSMTPSHIVSTAPLVGDVADRDEEDDQVDDAALLVVQTEDGVFESRYSITQESHKRRRTDTSLVFVGGGEEEEGEVSSDMSMSPTPTSAPAGRGNQQAKDSRVSRGARRAFWRAKSGREDRTADGLESEVDEGETV